VKTVLSKSDILKLIQLKPPLIENFLNLDEQLQPNGFDLSLQGVAEIRTRGRIAVSNSDREISHLANLDFGPQGFLILPPGSYVITYNEIVHIPKNVTAVGAPRSSLLRCGVTVHMAIWDAGYSGRSQSLMVVFNPAGFQLEKNARVAQLVFLQLEGDTEGYGGTYQGENIKLT
jgi:dUTP pyrophosphatase